MQDKDKEKTEEASINEEETLDSDDIIIDEEEGDPRAVLKKLRDRLKICEKEKIEYLGGWQRAKADYVNARKEEEKRFSELEPYIKQKILLELLPIADNFEMAFGNKEAWEKVDKNWRIGIEGMYSNLVNIFQSLGLEQVGAVGEKFDPSLHQAVGTVDVAEKEKSDMIQNLVQKGYKFKGKIIRPSKVVVGNYINK